MADTAAELAAAIGAGGPSVLKVAEPLARYTSFRIGGPADYFVRPASLEQLEGALSFAHSHDVPVMRLGGGTNLLISDRGVRGMVLRLGRAFDYRQWAAPEGGNVEVTVGAASSLGKFVREAVALGWGGVEFAAGIPGTVGGGALMNAGAFGGDLSETIVRIQGVSERGKRTELPREQLDFSYRRLALSADVMITSVTFRLRRAPVAKLQDIVHSVDEKRRRNQPAGYPNAGSIFKNPPGDYAGKLIEAAGLKGTSVGNAQISPDHANFIVNLGGARADDVRALMVLAQETVWSRSGLWLEPEVKLIGEWDEAAAVPTQA